MARGLRLRKLSYKCVRFFLEIEIAAGLAALTSADVLSDPRQEIIHSWRGVVTVHTQDVSPPNPDCIYDSVHQGIVSWPRWVKGNSYNGNRCEDSADIAACR